jgi:tripartite ATP-independent transporter DctP family solute receptor
MPIDIRFPISRRSAILAAGTTLCLPAIGRAAGAKFVYKCATGQAPTHPLNIRLQQGFDRIREKTGGALEFRLFPANQLGTETAVLSQTRLGSVEMTLLSASIYATFVPVAGIANTAYVFKDANDVWKAMDGALGQYTKAQTTKAGLIPAGNIWNNGFRQITSSTRDIRTPQDLKGFKIRVPPAPMLTSFFADMGAAPTPINFSEVYTALQTGVVDGQENGLTLVLTTRLYEVQKYCIMTGHSWDGYWPLANPAAWRRLPEKMQQIVVDELNVAADAERADVTQGDVTARADLTKKGLIFQDVDKAKFQQTLLATSYYRDWRAKYGEAAWSALELATGTLA